MTVFAKCEYFSEGIIYTVYSPPCFTSILASSKHIATKAIISIAPCTIFYNDTENDKCCNGAQNCTLTKNLAKHATLM